MIGMFAVHTEGKLVGWHLSSTSPAALYFARIYYVTSFGEEVALAIHFLS